jgi:chemotaxis protein methyltransferase CheR
MSSIMKEPPETRELEDLEIDLLLEAIRRRYGYDLQEYDRRFIRQRVRARLREEGVGSASQLQERVLRRPASFTAFVGPLEEGKPTLFRPLRVWKALRKRVLPALRTYPSVRVWVAGSSPDGELLSLLVLLEEELSRPYLVYATDLTDPRVRESRFGHFHSGHSQELSGGYLASGGRRRLSDYLAEGATGLRIPPALKSRIVFAGHNLATDASFNEFHLIILRWSLSQFSPPLRERSLRVVHQSLIRFGFLVLAPDEQPGQGIPTADYRTILRSAGLHQKVSD